MRAIRAERTSQNRRQGAARRRVTVLVLALGLLGTGLAIAPAAHASDCTLATTVNWVSGGGSCSGPSARVGASMAFDPGNQVAVLFGGCTGFEQTDTWVRFSAEADEDADWGKQTAWCPPNKTLNDTWIFDAGTGHWTNVIAPGAAGSPTARWSAAMTYDYASERIILVSGLYQTKVTLAAATPPAVNGGSVCWDASADDYIGPIEWVRALPVPQGAEPPGPHPYLWSFCFNDTWSLGKDGGGNWTWTQLDPEIDYEKRFDATVTYDSSGRPTLISGCQSIGAVGAHAADFYYEPVNWDCSEYSGTREYEFRSDKVPFVETGDHDIDEEQEEIYEEHFEAEHFTYTLADVWRLSWDADPAQGGTPKWVRVGCSDPQAGCGPIQRSGANIAYDPASGDIRMFGGYYFEPNNFYNPYIGDVWVWDDETLSWDQKETTGGHNEWCSPVPRATVQGGNSSVAVGSATGWQTLMFGGRGRWGDEFATCAPGDPNPQRDTSLFLLDETWRWDSTDCDVFQAHEVCWHELATAASPPPRSMMAMTYDHVHRRAILFGGFSSTSGNPDNAAPVGDTWTLLTPSSGTLSDPCLKFSGCGTTFANEVGSGRWAEQELEDLPPPPDARWAPAMAADPVRGVVVMFGGCRENNPCDGSGALGGATDETWIWDGEAWTRKITPIAPSPRYGASMAWDAEDERLILYGGASGAGGATTMLSDTWAFDGQLWTQLSPAASPGSRIWHGLATDSTDRVLLFGGCTGNPCSFRNETWRFDGTNWTKPCGTPVCGGSPSARLVIGQMATDASGKVILFGGPTAAGTFPADTWSWNGTAWSQITATGSPTGRSGGAMAKVNYFGTWGLLLYGGGTDQLPLSNETWLFLLDAGGTSGQWYRVQCCGTPGPRQTFGMALNPADGKIVQFGGLVNFGGQTGGTWVFSFE